MPAGTLRSRKHLRQPTGILCLFVPAWSGRIDLQHGRQFRFQFRIHLRRPTGLRRLGGRTWTNARPLRQITMCAWIKTTDQQNYGTVFSYATDEEANSLTLTDYSGFVFTSTAPKW